MLNPVSKWRHAMVGVTVLVAPVLAVTGLIGAGKHSERFDAKQVLVTPDGTDGVRVREVVDEDFGTHDEHGYERLLPNDFGVPTAVEASSPDAPEQVSVTDEQGRTRIRIGDPDTTIDGQHRYVLSYTLPAARLTSGTLALDIIGSDETFETRHFEVVLAGFELKDTTCNVGPYGTVGGCSLTRDGDVYRVVFEPLHPNDGITVGGTIVSLGTPAEVPVPAIPPRRDDSRLPLTLITLVIGLVIAFGGYRLARQMGRNQVGGTGAADAAFAAPGSPTRLVTDADLAGMATTEFVPPTGIRPWQGAMLLNERVDNTSVSAWFSDQIAAEFIVLEGTDPQVLKGGPKLSSAPAATQERIGKLIAGDGEMQLGTYHPSLAALWKELTDEQQQAATASGWWAKYPPGTSAHFPVALSIAVVFAGAATAIALWKGFAPSWWVAISMAIAIPGFTAASAYRGLLPVRSAAGTAVALRVESFRHFLEASEGTHVDWAWSHGLLREYSAWAVALGAADAWGRAVDASAVPPAEVSMSTMPLLMYTNMGAWSSTRVQPSQSGGSGGGFGGGFSGGFSGGGGGGGSSGSW